MKEPAANQYLTTTLLPWHAEPYRQLLELHAGARLGHAWLLAGQQGTGKLALALHVARALLCSQLASGQPCGRCAACHLFAAGSHPDFRLVVPEKKLLTIDQIRDSIDFAHNTSARGGMQVLIFDPAEAMNNHAANALLKLLEEPPAHTLLLLISHQPGLLLPTIRSRCQRLYCPLPPPAIAGAWLESQGFAGDTAAALRRAGGAPLHALAESEAGAQAERLTLLECLQKLPVHRLYPVEAAKKCEKFNIVATIDYLLACVADLAGNLQAALPLRDPDLKELAALLREGNQAPQMDMQLHAMHAILVNARKVAMASNNANAQLLLESLFGTWSRLRSGNLES
jgi:DNA polymerase-3 subunit delta'